MEVTWTQKSLYADAKEIAEKLNEPLAIEHFWMCADLDLAGEAPRDQATLIARAKNYIVLDLTIAEKGFAGDPDIDASLKRKAIFTAFSEEQSTKEFPLTDKQKQEADEEFLQFMCKTNLLFLGREIFNKKFTFLTHARVCNFFVQKNPSAKLIHQDDRKNRLLMYPRGSFKSTIDVIDAVQWIINFPDVRILVLTATADLATAFIGEMKNYFITVPEAAPTPFQMLFPKFTVSTRKNEGAEDQFICPCRKPGDDRKKEPTAWATSILSNLPGWHCDLMKSDDVINDKNSDTAPLIAKTKRKSNLATALVDPGGYKDHIGTPYAPNDLYTHIKTKVKDLIEIWKPAWWLKPESIGKDERDCVDADYTLLFEFDKTGDPRLDHKFLREARELDPEMFNSQYLLNPAGIKKIKFSLELLQSRTISRDQLPMKLVYYILWDFAYGVNARNDFSVGAVIALDEENRAYVIEVFRDHYLESDLAKEIANSNKQYMPKLIPIENSNGAQLLQPTIRAEAAALGIDYIPLDFFKIDTSANAKATRIGTLQPLLESGKLFFLNEIDCLLDLYREFKDFGVDPHDDIPDAISHLYRILPTVFPEPGGQVGGKERVQHLLKTLQEKDFYDMIFQEGDYTPVVPDVPIQPEPGTGESDDLEDPFAVPGLGAR